MQEISSGMADVSSEDYRLVLPENVALRFDVAGVGSRTIAAIIDYVIMYVGIMADVKSFSMIWFAV
jgi:hypothetical protein